MTGMQAREMDESAFYLLDTVENVLHGGDGPWPYQSKAAAVSAAARKNRKAKTRRYSVVTWLMLRKVA